MVVKATAYYQEEEAEEIKCKLKASVQIDSDTQVSDDIARVMARNLYQNMLMSIPNGRGGKENVVKQDVHMAE